MYDPATGVWTVGTVTSAVPQTLTITAVVASPAAQTRTRRTIVPPPTSSTRRRADNTCQRRHRDAPAVRPCRSRQGPSSDPTPNVGDTITYAVTLANNGPDSATNVTVLDTLPAGVAFVSSLPSRGNYDPITDIWTVGTVDPGAPQILIVTASVVGASPGANTASVGHSDQFDPNPANNSDTASVDPQEANLAVSKTVSNARPNVGDTVTFTVTLTNNGQQTPPAWRCMTCCRPVSRSSRTRPARGPTTASPASGPWGRWPTGRRRR